MRFSDGELDLTADAAAAEGRFSGGTAVITDALDPVVEVETALGPDIAAGPAVPGTTEFVRVYRTGTEHIRLVTLASRPPSDRLRHVLEAEAQSVGALDSNTSHRVARSAPVTVESTFRNVVPPRPAGPGSHVEAEVERDGILARLLAGDGGQVAVISGRASLLRRVTCAFRAPT